ncbi:MAG: ComEC family competence protein [Chitinophagaceae bacterium]|nr:ComEC family competence protein [Chitinophagaceae bacterium]
MSFIGSNFWKKSPFIKLLLSLVAGIILQWYVQLTGSLWIIFLSIFLFASIAYAFVPLIKRMQLNILYGIIVSILFICIGGLLSWTKDIRNNKEWFAHRYNNRDAFIIKLDEQPVEKTKSIKANGVVTTVIKNEKAIPVKGKIIIYFQKDSSFHLSYGNKILITKPLQEIKNSGNPGGFDYKRYSLFQGITHQVYLKANEYEVLKETEKDWFTDFIISTREKILIILRKNIKSEKELGLAEALLIGYKNDLEQSLVQSYTNTGVVHIIAISGLHLGLIYWLLAIILSPLKRKKIRWLRPVLIIFCLWLFSLLAGAGPSILRSAVMFTFIAAGESFGRKNSIYNTIAASAFLLLCINPYWLWDVGFQLSYTAVLSLIIFIRPIYNWFYITNKALDFIWKMNAVTLAAQILTIPISLYHFHQFPNLFFLTNFLAVPLSSIILLGEIILCSISFIPVLSVVVGKILVWLIWLMNTYIERIEAISFSLWDGLQINILQTSLLILFVAGVSQWLMNKSIAGLKYGLIGLLFFSGIRSYSFIRSELQQKIVVYNVPQKKAIDFISGRNYFFTGDSDLLKNDFARNFHLKPSRILFRINSADQIDNLISSGNYFMFGGKRILMLDSSARWTDQQTEKPAIDLLVISQNPKLYIKQIAKVVNIRQVVFDGSVPAWKTKYWKADCDSLHIPWYDVTTKGAFVMTLN